jgi:hypothetical protein
MKGLRGKNVLVTGGSSGIGQAIAIRFGQEGANVAINYRKGLAEAQHTEEAIREAMDQAVDSCMNQMKAAGEKPAANESTWISFAMFAAEVMKTWRNGFFSEMARPSCFIFLPEFGKTIGPLVLYPKSIGLCLYCFIKPCQCLVKIFPVIHVVHCRLEIRRLIAFHFFIDTCHYFTINFSGNWEYDS